jgi:hypothetical protein
MKGHTMTKRKHPNSEPFRRSQVVSPVPSARRFAKARKAEHKNFDIYVTDIETGDETLAITVSAPTQRDAIQTGRKRLQSSPVCAGSRMRHFPPSSSTLKSAPTKRNDSGRVSQARPFSQG